MQKKDINYNFQVKSAGEDGTFAGYASVFGIVDGQNDVIMQGAFTHTLKKRAGAVRLLWQHQAGEPIGVFTTIREDAHGLYVEGRLLLELQRGLEAYTLLKNLAINGLSIGYSVKEADYNPEIGIRLITKVDLWEISLVTFPANEEAVVMRVKEKESRKNRKNHHPDREKNKEEWIASSRSLRSTHRNDDVAIIDSIDRAIGVLGFSKSRDDKANNSL